MKNIGNPISEYLSLFAALFMSLLLCGPAHAQSDPFGGGFGPDDEEMEEIVTVGQRPTFSSYFTTTVYGIPEGLGRGLFLAQLNAVLDWNPETASEDIDESDIDARCNQNASGFRQTCLAAANTANTSCATLGVGVTSYGLFMGVLPGAISAAVFAGGCTYANNVAVNSCNAAADNSTYPGASQLCQ